MIMYRYADVTKLYEVSDDERNTTTTSTLTVSYNNGHYTDVYLTDADIGTASSSTASYVDSTHTTTTYVQNPKEVFDGFHIPKPTQRFDRPKNDKVRPIILLNKPKTVFKKVIRCNRKGIGLRIKKGYK